MELLGVGIVIGAFVIFVWRKDAKREAKFTKYLEENNLTREDCGF